MALKLFCSKCEEKIKEVTPDEASRLPEDVICEKCEQFVNNALENFLKIAKQKQQQVAGVINGIVVELEELRRKALD